MVKTTISAAPSFDSLVRQARATKQYLVAQRALMVAASCSATVPLAVIQHFMQVIPAINALAQSPGITAYAQRQYDDENYDVVAEFGAMRDAMNNALAGLQAAFPADGNGWLLYQKFAGGAITTRNFTAAQLAAAVGLVDSVIAAID